MAENSSSLWIDPIGNYLRIKSAVTTLSHGAKSLGEKLDAATYALVFVRPDDAPPKIKVLLEKIRDRMISVHKTYGTNDYFNFKALPNNTKNDLVEIILAVNENILLDIGSIDENREIIEAKVFDV